jgi:PAS domain S-box-containing protein
MEKEKTKEQLLSELAIMRQQLLEAKRRVAELETLEKERKQAQETLRDSQEQLELIIDSFPALIGYVDSNQRYLHVNQAYADWYGRSKQELVGKHLRDVLYEESYQGAIDYIKTVLQGQEASYENISYDAQGQMRAVSAAYIPHFDETGKVKAFLGLVQDITARKQALAALRESEERYRSVVENSHAGVLIVGDAYRIVYVNDQLCRMLGYQQGELINRDFRELLSDEARGLVADRYVRRQRGEEVPPRYELTIVRKDGERRQVEIHAATIRDSAGAVQTVGQFLDITER